MRQAEAPCPTSKCITATKQVNTHDAGQSTQTFSPSPVTPKRGENSFSRDEGLPDSTEAVAR